MNINKIYHINCFKINQFINDKTFFISNNIKFNLNCFNIKHIYLNEFIKIYEYLKNNHLMDILILFNINYNVKINGLNRYNYINKFKNSFNLIFKHEYLTLINLFYYHLTKNDILKQ